MHLVSLKFSQKISGEDPDPHDFSSLDLDPFLLSRIRIRMILPPWIWIRMILPPWIQIRFFYPGSGKIFIWIITPAKHFLYLYFWHLFQTGLNSYK